MSTATYIRHGRGKSINAISAESDGTLTGSAWAKKLGKGVTAADIEKVLGRGEWHHTGKFANRTNYYEPAEIEEVLEAILEAKALRVAATVATTQTGTVSYRIWIGMGKRKKPKDMSFTGEITIKGDWCHFNNGKMLMSGSNFFGVKFN